jgi:subtilisin family serine protease
VDLTAPVPPGFCSSGFALATGTSFAAPAVAGVAARVEAVRPNLKPGELGELLRASARPIGDPEAGAGIVDLTRALTQPAPPADAAEVDDSAGSPGAHRAFRTGRHSGTVRTGEDPADSYTIVVGRGARPRFTTRGHVVVRRRRLNARRWLLSVEPAHGESTLVRYVLNVRGRKP